MKIDKPWYEYLRRKHKKRRKKKGRRVHTSPIPDRVSIRKRLKVIDKRKAFGHWEADTVESSGHRDGIHTEVERMSRFIMAQKVTSITSKATITIQKKLFGSLPKQTRQSTTLDNGRENHMHTKLKQLNINTCFADSYASWQRGTNEHGN